MAMPGPGLGALGMSVSHGSVWAPPYLWTPMALEAETGGLQPSLSLPLATASDPGGLL